MTVIFLDNSLYWNNFTIQVKNYSFLSVVNELLVARNDPVFQFDLPHLISNLIVFNINTEKKWN